ncbi:MAG TPA: MBL fold metallo-hydrolase [Acidimicrobiales bacterium]|nr:MBL fold metallo-hydrolase [Acidimicrobiales bacterium]
MDDVENVWSDASVEVRRLVVGPMENNVYIVRDRRTGEATLIDAANEPDRLLAAAAALGVTSVLTTHGHWDHIQAVAPVREAGIPVWVREEDAAELSGYDHLLQDDDVLSVGDLRVRTVHTPGHTPGSICFLVEGTPLLFTGDTLFPGGPGATGSNGGDFATIITSIEERLFRVMDDETIIWPGHGASSTIGVERPHLDEWIERGW